MISAVDKEISVKELSEILSISEATARNWIKLNKIQPSYTENSVAYFSKEYAQNLLKNIKSKSSSALKSRRNKKYVSGAFFYKDYLSSGTKNINLISSLLCFISENNLSLSDSEIKYIVADCAIQLLLQRKDFSPKIKNNFLYEYLNKNLSLNSYNSLIDDLIDKKECALKFIKNNPHIFSQNYVYEKNEDILGLLYISLSDLGSRKANGAYYTPVNIVKKNISALDFNNFNKKKVIDPCCGSGNFLLQLPDNIPVNCVFGNDIDETAIKITRINMALKFKINDINILYKNFTNKDFLLGYCDKKFDFIIGNPPWGAVFPKETIKKLREKYLSTDNKNIESYDVFTEKSLSCLNPDGYLSFVLPEAILSVRTHKTIRNIILQDNCVKYLEYLGNMFDKVQCPSIILQIKHTNSSAGTVGMKVVRKNKSFVINTKREINPDVFSFDMDDEEYRIYEKILNIKNKFYLKGNAIFALGLVTGNNTKYISDKKTKDNEIVLKGSDIEKFKIKIPQRYISYEPQNFQQVAPTKYYRAKEKLLYKFISKKLVFAYDNSQTLSLNSCNILIPEVENVDIKYVMAILNSRIAQFIFEKTYNSVKVLRSHIESIPIPLCDKNIQAEIAKITDEISGADNSDLYEILESKIAKLYNITSKEYNIIFAKIL